MSSPIAFGGLASGLDWRSLVDQLYNVSYQAQVTPLETRKSDLDRQNTDMSTLVGKLNTLMNSVKAFTDATPDNSVFSTKSVSFASDADKSKVTFNVTNSAATGPLSLQIVRLATKTSVASSATVSNAIDATTGISAVNGGITAGTMTVFFGSTAKTVTVNSTDTVQDVINSVSAAATTLGQTVNGSVGPDGKLTFTNVSGPTLKFGASNDTSNFATKTYLDTQTAAASVTSGNLIRKINFTTDVSNASTELTTPVTAGSQFSINGVSFDTTGKTLNQIMAEVNNSSAKVNLTYDATTDKFTLKSTVDGSNFIAMSDTSGNFLSALNLTGAQTAGQTAQYSVNGGAVQDANSNAGITVTPGLTMDLKGGEGTTVNITVGGSPDAAKASAQTFVNAYNDVVRFIKDKTDVKSGTLKSYSVVKSLLNTLSSSMQEATGSGSYTTMASIGISTGAITGTLGTVTRELTLNSGTLATAIAANPSTVENIFKTILGNVKTTLTGATQAVTGTLPSTQSSIQSRISSTNDAITRAKARLDAYQKNLLAQFQAMEKAIADTKNQTTQFTQQTAGR